LERIEPDTARYCTKIKNLVGKYKKMNENIQNLIENREENMDTGNEEGERYNEIIIENNVRTQQIEKCCKCDSKYFNSSQTRWKWKYNLSCDIVQYAIQKGIIDKNKLTQEQSLLCYVCYKDIQNQKRKEEKNVNSMKIEKELQIWRQI
jgi:hypothetical protein